MSVVKGRARDERGFSLVELLVAMTIFGIITTAFYSILFSATDSAETTRAVAGASNEARRGFNRLLRDTREASDIYDVDANSFTIENDFDADGSIEPVPTEDFGNYERLTFTWVPGAAGSANGRIIVGNGVVTETLIQGADCVRNSSGAWYPVFTFSSNDLTYDSNGDGTTSALEIDAAPTIGDGDGTLDTAMELNTIDTVSFMMRVTVDGRSEQFYGAAQMRNSR